MGWDFYINANGAFWSNVFYGTDVPIPVWPYPVQFATFMTSSKLLQLMVPLPGWDVVVAAGPVRCAFSSTRVIFAAALDRMLPEWVSKIEPRTRTPINALLLMVIPSVIISILYAFNIVNFQSIVLDATLVIAVTFPWDHIGGYPVAMAAEGYFRRFADCALHYALLVELAGDGVNLA